MPRYAIVVQYIGDAYAGSQVQPTHNTIQQELEKAICTLINQNTKPRLILSGRTDKGVHAKGQVGHFDCDCEVEEKWFVNAMNGILPKDISVLTFAKVDDKFHAQKSAKYRWYRYEIVNRLQRSAWDKHSLLIRYPLCLDRMSKALSYIAGEHDFSAFRSLKSDNPNPICNVSYAHARKCGDKVLIDVVANRFLYNMIRILVGTLLDIERNSLAPEALKEILETKDRTKAGMTVSPSGLKLMKVAYTKTFNENEINNIITMEKTTDENLFSKTS